MGSIIIFSNPLILLGYGAALLIGIYGMWKQIGGFWLPLLSVVCCVLTTTYALVKGASLYEVGLMMIVFVLVNMSVYQKDENDEDDETDGRENK